MKMRMSRPDITVPSPPPRSRIELVDLARGIALLAMFVFHFAYDLSHFGLIDVDIQAQTGWRVFARLIAGSFLTLVGASLVLATRDGLNGAAYLRRLAMVAGAAALVTLGTYVAMRDSFIFFGILHHVALASVLALPFLRLPTPAIGLAAGAAFALPVLIAHPVLDQPALLWLGLSRDVPSTADFVPVLPWFGCVLAGMMLARLALPHLAGSRFAAWQARSRAARLIVWGGRHSLLVYLVHQPLFIGAILLTLQVTARPPSEERPFMLSCQRSCAGGSLSADACEKLCTCTVDGLKRSELWRKVLADALSPEERARVASVAQACVAAPAARP